MTLTVPVTKKKGSFIQETYRQLYVKILSHFCFHEEKCCVKLDHLLLRSSFAVRTEGPYSLMLFPFKFTDITYAASFHFHHFREAESICIIAGTT